MLKLGDYVTVKDGTILENGDVVNNWGGKITATNFDLGICRVSFDALTLDALSDKYLTDCIDEGTQSYSYVLNFDELEKSSRRDTDRQFNKAAINLGERRTKLAQEENQDEQVLQGRKWTIWLKGFEGSDFIEELDIEERNSAEFIVQTFLDYSDNYLGVTAPDLLNKDDLREICLNLAPNKISADSYLFDYYGEVVLLFLKYYEGLDESSSTKILQECLVEIKDQIPEIAKDSSGWGFAKTMMMNAKNEGVDLTDQSKVEAYVSSLNDKLPQKNWSTSSLVANPYKNIGRNDRVTVKFNDGNLIENIKFKKVKDDLEHGRCELVL